MCLKHMALRAEPWSPFLLNKKQQLLWTSEPGASSSSACWWWIGAYRRIWGFQFNTYFSLPWRDFLEKSPVSGWSEGPAFLQLKLTVLSDEHATPSPNSNGFFLFSIRVPGYNHQEVLSTFTSSRCSNENSKYYIILLPKYETTLYFGWASRNCTLPRHSLPPLWPVCLLGIPPFDKEVILPCLTGFAAALSEQETEPLEDPSRYAVFYSSIQRCDQFCFWQKWNFHSGKTAV